MSGVRLQHNILLVDDDPNIRNSMVAFLKDEGFAVRAVETGEEAIAIVRQGINQFSLGVIDFHMPGMNGPEVIETVSVLSKLLGRMKIKFLLRKLWKNPIQCQALLANWVLAEAPYEIKWKNMESKLNNLTRGMNYGEINNNTIGSKYFCKQHELSKWRHKAKPTDSTMRVSSSTP